MTINAICDCGAPYYRRAADGFLYCSRTRLRADRCSAEKAKNGRRRTVRATDWRLGADGLLYYVRNGIAA